MRCNLFKNAPVEVKCVSYCLVEVCHDTELKSHLKIQRKVIASY